MKNVFLSLFLSLLLTVNLFAQNQGASSIAVNVNYGTKVESLGIGLRGQYGFTDHLRGIAEYKYYIDRHNLSSWQINVDGHYLLKASESVYLYPVAGVNFTRWTYDPERSKSPGVKYSNNRLGLNLGLGTQVALSDNLYLQVEAKEAFIKSYYQFDISAGIMYQF